jgi:hypothetical protein
MSSRALACAGFNSGLEFIVKKFSLILMAGRVRLTYQIFCEVRKGASYV